MGCFALTVGCVMFFQGYQLGLLVLVLGLALVIAVLSIW
jgi:ABC-type bacteriocin/lantibiotic exporter with double-glycine peptidase domain